MQHFSIYFDPNEHLSLIVKSAELLRKVLFTMKKNQLELIITKSVPMNDLLQLSTEILCQWKTFSFSDLALKKKNYYSLSGFYWKVLR